MPSWFTPMTSEMFSIAVMVVRAIRDPASARGSSCVRRADTRANSAPTKKALPSSSSTARTTAAPALTARHRPRPAPRGTHNRSRSMRSPSIRSTPRTAIRSPSSSGSERSGTTTSARSPTSGTRPSVRSTRPAIVS